MQTSGREREKELQKMRKEISEIHKARSTEEFNKMKEEMEKRQEEKIKDAERNAQIKYENTISKTREIAREEIEKGKDKGSTVINTVWGFAKLVLPGIFSKLG